MTKYDKIISLILERIASGALREGDRLPSVRQMARITGFSEVTVHHGYGLLESRGICRARPRSGYFVTKTAAGLPQESPHALPGQTSEVADGIGMLLLPQRDLRLETFGAMHLSDDLVRRDTADKVMRHALRTGSRRLAEGLLPDGDLRMRQEICRHIAKRGTFALDDEIIITGSAIQAYNLCLDTFTRPGDMVLVECPSYFPMLATLRRRDLRVIEIESDPVTGIDPEAFREALSTHSVRVALLMVTNHFPTGLTYPTQTMRALVEAAASHDVTIIENDMFGDLTFSERPRVTLKHFDEHDNVVQIGSFEFTLPPEYGYGWVVSGRHKRDLLITHYMNGHRLRDGFIQRGIADYLSGRSYDRQLRNLNQTLAARMTQGIAGLRAQSGDQIPIAMPSGGFMCWLKLPEGTDAEALSHRLLAAEVSILPGAIFSLGPRYAQFIGLNFSFPWSEENSGKLARIIEALAG